VKVVVLSGDTFGRGFVYPKSEAAQIANQVKKELSDANLSRDDIQIAGDRS